MLHLADDDFLVATPVSVRVNSVRTDDADGPQSTRDQGQIPLF
jgi:hypothetical protein